MNQSKTLHQIKDELGLSRKAIQGYEKHELIRSCGKDKFGHLLYDEKTVEKIIRIRFFQKLGFEVSQIKEFIDLPEKELTPILKTRKEHITNQIRKLKELYGILDDLLKSDKLNKETILMIVKEETE